jgi:hypothetical protein
MGDAGGMSAVDSAFLADLLTAGLKPELVARIVSECADAYARGVVDGTPRMSPGAIRQARYRGRNNVTEASQSVTNRNEASQVTPPLSPTPPISKSNNKKHSMRDRGTRIPDDWRPSEVDLASASAEGLSASEIQREAARFVDYWKGKSGQAGIKLDWSATWRNWCRNAAERLGRKPRGEVKGDPGVFVSAESPAFDAWNKHAGKRHPVNRNGGWYFPTEYPPGMQAA